MAGSEVRTDLGYCVEIPDADAELQKRCIIAAQKQYGDPLPEVISDRLMLELNAIIENHYASHYLIGAMIAEQSNNNGRKVSSRGMIGSSFISYLCGISMVNPLPAHYWCHECHYFEQVIRAKNEPRIMGYDLPEKVCPKCGNAMNAEGADIEPEVLFGIEFNREPDIIMNVDKEIRPRLFGFLKDHFGENRVFRAGVNKQLPDGSVSKNVHPGGIFIIPQGFDVTDYSEIRAEIPRDCFGLKVMDRDYLEVRDILKKYDILTLSEVEILNSLEMVTGELSDNIKTNDEEVLSVFLKEGFSFLPGRNPNKETDLDSNVVFKIEPQSFSDLVRIAAIVHATDAWCKNGELLISEGRNIKELVSCRDDVMQKMLDAGLERELSYGIMNNVRKGKGTTKEMKWAMKDAGIPDWYIVSCDLVTYLYPKSQAVDYMLLYWKLAYYRRNYPKEYMHVLDDHIKQCS